MNAKIGALLRFALFAVLTSCGGGDSAPPPTVTISPSTATLRPGDAAVFNATVSGSSNSAVTWTVQEGATGGSISDTGVYTAPVTNGTFHVIATSQANTTALATAAVTVYGTFAVTPASIVLGPMGGCAFYANVAVTWSVQEGAAGGAITADGQYTAPLTPGAFHVIAASVQDPSKTVVVNVTVVSSGFQSTGIMSTPRTGPTATLLQSGKVLVTGGNSCYFLGYYSRHCPLASAEIYDPGTGTFATTGTMAVKRVFHTATPLSNGKVLVAGGPDASAELYDPASGTFAATGSMSVARSSHTATLLANGKVLITGGYNASGTLDSAELYDLSTGTFSATGTMTTAHASHSATLLANGKVLIAGGFNSTGTLTTAELYDPTTGTFSAANSTTSKRRDHTATLLGNSSVLVAGGDDNGMASSSAEVYDGVTGSFVVTGPMMTARTAHVAILLNNGTVLIAGGSNSTGGSDLTAELYDVASGSFSQTGSLGASREFPAAVLLPDGRVFICGGSDSAAAELYK